MLYLVWRNSFVALFWKRSVPIHSKLTRKAFEEIKLRGLERVIKRNLFAHFCETCSITHLKSSVNWNIVATFHVCIAYGEIYECVKLFFFYPKIVENKNIKNKTKVAAQFFLTFHQFESPVCLGRDFYLINVAKNKARDVIKLYVPLN